MGIECEDNRLRDSQFTGKSKILWLNEHEMKPKGYGLVYTELLKC